MSSSDFEIDSFLAEADGGLRLRAVRYVHIPSTTALAVKGRAAPIPDRPTMQVFTSYQTFHEMSDGVVRVVGGEAYAGWTRTPDENEYAVTLLPRREEWRAMRPSARGLGWMSSRPAIPRFDEQCAGAATAAAASLRARQEGWPLQHAKELAR